MDKQKQNKVDVMALMRQARMDQALTWDQVAEQFGISRRVLTDWKAGIRAPSELMVARIMLKLGKPEAAK